MYHLSPFFAKKEEDTRRVSSSFFRTSCGKGLERINPTVRWTVGRHRLDGGETSIFAKGENASESLPVYHVKGLFCLLGKRGLLQ